MKTYVIVGTGARGTMYRDVFLEYFPGKAKLLAVCDKNQGRLNLVLDELRPKCPDIRGYDAKDFDKMLQTHRPDAVIVCTMDSTHSDYICRSLMAGCDVITEKPMTNDERQCQKIIDAVKQTGKSVRVTFNYRYSPPRTQVKDLLMRGTIGKVLSVEFQWLLDTSHGADYFRRWHRNKENSGGLMVHKATHHFDLINWWLSSVPVSVFAEGARVFYNRHQANRYALDDHSHRCCKCKVASKCNFYLNLNSFNTMKKLYVENECYDGYFRDKCVFSDEIDIEDTMNVVVKYKSGAFLSYSLNAFSPWEGYKLAINGTKGRMEQDCHESSYINGDGNVQGGFQACASSLKIFPHFKTPYEIKMWDGEGDHGGGDIVMLKDIFDCPEPDPYMRSADYVQGAYSILVGIAANKSMASDKKIYINELVSGLGEPIYPAMPDGSEEIPYVMDVSISAGGKQHKVNAIDAVKTNIAEPNSASQNDAVMAESK